MKLVLSEKAEKIFSFLQEKLGRENVFIVGGYVRDALLGKESTDIDFATSVSPEKVREAFCYGQYFRKFGTVSFELDGFDVTIASFRKEKDYVDHRHPQTVEFITSLYEDYLRRDFTINSLYLNADGEIIDPCGKGLSDLKRKIIRVVGNPDARLDEDPLRIIRAYRFRYKFSFRFALRTQTAIRRKRKLLSLLSENKVKEEIEKCVPEKREELVRELGLTML